MWHYVAPAFMHPQQPRIRGPAAPGRPAAALHLLYTLYTDGLIERRGRSIDDGLNLLSHAAAVVTDLPLGQAVRSLTHTLLQDGTRRRLRPIAVLVRHAVAGHLTADPAREPSARAAPGLLAAHRGRERGRWRP